jgi:hypothetical protein
LPLPLHPVIDPSTRCLTCLVSRSTEFDHGGISVRNLWYNFVKIHKAHKLTPAMAAEITDKLWSVEDIVALASEPKPGKRGPYKKRIAA